MPDEIEMELCRAIVWIICILPYFFVGCALYEWGPDAKSFRIIFPILEFHDFEGTVFTKVFIGCCASVCMHFIPLACERIWKALCEFEKFAQLLSPNGRLPLLAWLTWDRVKYAMEIISFIILNQWDGLFFYLLQKLLEWTETTKYPSLRDGIGIVLKRFAAYDTKQQLEFTASGPGLEQIPVGEPTEFSIGLKMPAKLPKVEITDSGGELLPVDVAACKKLPFRTVVKYTPRNVGDQQVTITWKGQPIENSPFTVKAFDPNSVRLILNEEYGEVDRVCAFTVEAEKAGAGKIEVIVSGGKQILSKDLQVLEDDIARRLYSFIPSVAREHTISVKFNGIHVSGSPMRFPVWSALSPSPGPSCSYKELPTAAPLIVRRASSSTQSVHFPLKCPSIDVPLGTAGRVDCIGLAQTSGWIAASITAHDEEGAASMPTISTPASNAAAVPVPAEGNDAYGGAAPALAAGNAAPAENAAFAPTAGGGAAPVAESVPVPTVSTSASNTVAVPTSVEGNVAYGGAALTPATAAPAESTPAPATTPSPAAEKPSEGAAATPAESQPAPAVGGAASPKGAAPSGHSSA